MTVEIKCSVCGKKKTVVRRDAIYCSQKCKSLGWAIKNMKSMKVVDIRKRVK